MTTNAEDEGIRAVRAVRQKMLNVSNFALRSLAIVSEAHQPVPAPSR